MFYAKLHFMKNMVCIILGALMVFSVQAQKRGYIYTTNGVDADYREIKNLNVVRGVDGEGFLQVHAIVGNDRWNVRCIRTDDTGTVIWMKEYNFRPHSGLDTSTCPFAVCHNLTNDGYVIAGIWSMTFSYDHSSLESPFYIEIDDYGALIQAKRQRISMDTCFAPLKIKPSYEDQTYVVVGVSGNRMDKITSDYRAARVCKLDAQLNELPGARELKSTYATSASIAANGIVYDAFNNVEVFNDGSGYAYVVSGCVTDDLYRANTSHPDFGNYGRAVPFIAKMDTNLNIIWNKADYSINSTYDHSIVTDVTYDQDRNSLYVIHMRSSTIGDEKALEVRELDYNTGNEAQDPVYTSTSVGSAPFALAEVSNYYFSNTFVSGDELILVGYALENRTRQILTNQEKIDPFVIALDKSDLSQMQYAYYEPAKTHGFLDLSWVQGYLGYRYPLSNADFWVADASSTPFPYAKKTAQSHSPLIYFPEMTVTGLRYGDVQPVILAISGAENYMDLAHTTPKFPYLYHIQNSICNDSSTSAEPLQMLELGQINIEDTTINRAENLNDQILITDFDIFYRECAVEQDQSFQPLKISYLHMSSSENVMEKFEDLLQREESDQRVHWELMNLSAINGVLHHRNQSRLSPGIYVASFISPKNRVRIVKIIVTP